LERQLTYAQAINEALHEAMAQDPRVICYGLGVSDPKSVFGTTSGLREKYGPVRVFDMPTSENAMTGVAVGAAIAGLRPVMTHQRTDFFLLAMDQLVNSAAKWFYTFGGKSSVPITIRLIVGRGWGQGPTHSQTLQSWFAHIPGLKVVMPTLAADAKGLLLSSIFDPNPVVFIEHRWLHGLAGAVPPGDRRVPLGKAAVLHEGCDITLVGMSHMTVEALRAADFVLPRGVQCDVLDLRTVSPLDWEAVRASVRKTGRLLALDTGWPTCSVASEIVARVAMDCWRDLKQAPRRLTLPDFPIPSSAALTANFYPRAEDIVRIIEQMLGRDCGSALLAKESQGPRDVPDAAFRGPF
jgi:pyruvate dehydrogenase E1 component beta subunit